MTEIKEKANKIFVEWHDSYSVGIKLIDDQHKELINLTNRLYTSCMTSQEESKATFLEVIHETVNYVGYHFGTEEKIMERVNYLEFPQHKKEHTEFVKEVLTKVEEFKAGKLLVTLNFVHFLKDWVLKHIAISDKKLGKFLQHIHDNGIQAS